MKNILYISPSIKVKGGISTVIKGYLRSDLAKKYRIYLVSSHVDGNKFIKLLIAVVGIIKTFFVLLFNNIDIVHIHGSDIISSSRKYIYFKVIENFKCKVIYHFHGSSLIEQSAAVHDSLKRRIKYLFEKVDLVICLSESWKKSILEFVPESNIVVIPNSVRLPDLCVKISKNHSDRLKITFLGLIGESKGVFDLIPVVKRLGEAGRNLELNIGGNGKVDRLLAEIESLGLGDIVNFLGWISESERDALLRNTDIFVLPSYAEGMPMSILEAMSYGIPIVSTTVGGIPELVPNNKAGFLVEPGDLDALYEKIDLLCRNQETRLQFGKTARGIIQTKYNLDIVSQQLEQIYNTI